MKRVVFTCGRCNPVTVGHRKLFEAAEAVAKGDPIRVFLTKTRDEARNPLPPEEKVSFVQRLFPALDVRLATNAWDAAKLLAKEGFTDAVFLVGEDRYASFKELPSYVDHADPKKRLGLKKVEVCWIPRAAGGVSGTEARDLAVAGDFAKFAGLIPSDDCQLIEQLYHAVRRGMGVK